MNLSNYFFSFSFFNLKIILILGFAALAAAKTPTLTLHNSLEPPLDYIPVNSGGDISSKATADSKPPSNFPGIGYIHPLCPDGSVPPCAEQKCPDGSAPPCKNEEQTCPNGQPPPCKCPDPLIGTPPNCKARPYLPEVVIKPQCKK